jgi:uncharacterized membrane protein YvlD (DUF360 family)
VVLLISFVIRVAVALVALAVAELVLDDFSISLIGYPVVAVIFALVSVVVRPALDRLFEDRAGPSAVFAGLAAAFVALLVTNLVTDSLEISGASTWVLATVIVWIAGLAADLLLGGFLRRRMIRERQERR